jgi:hypothetical protein
MLWKEWQLKLICKYLPKRLIDGNCVVDYAEYMEEIILKDVVSGIKFDLEEDAESLLNQLDERYRLKM